MAACGDAVVDAGEQCDNGNQNSDSAIDACRLNCSEARCGDGVTDTGEECDDGPANSDIAPDVCRLGCVAPSCGDGVVDENEQCDAGSENSDTLADACRTTCRSAVCGDSVVDDGEQCDEGASNSDADPLVCRRDCNTEFLCGDADRNERVTAVDAQKVLRYVVGLVADCDMGRCDATGDGRVRTTDAQLVLRRAVDLLPSLDCSLSVKIRVEDSVTLTGLDFEIDYSTADSAFQGRGATVSCQSLINGVIGMFSNDEDEAMLTGSVAGTVPFTGPIDIATCHYRVRVQNPPLATLSLAVRGASDAAGRPMTEPPSTVLNY